MKKYFKLLMVALFATLSFSLVSCGDDDDAEDAIIGTWEQSYSEDQYAYYQVITFNKDNTFATTMVETTPSHTTTENLYGTYAISGDIKSGAALVMNFIDEDGDTWTESGSVRIDGKSAYIILDGDDVGVFTKK